MKEKSEFTKGQKSYLGRYVNQFKSEKKEALDSFEIESEKSISQFEEAYKDALAKIDDLEEKKSALEEKNSSLNLKLDEVNDFHSTVFEKDDDGNIISEEIEGYVEKFKDSKNEIEKIEGDIKEYKKKLFGYEDDEGNEINGLKHKIENLKDKLQTSIKESQTKLDGFTKENDAKQQELFNKIESLLKGASNVALAASFKEHKESFNISNYIWMVSFILSISAMMLLSAWGFINANYEFKDMWKYTLGNLPFIGGAIWLAIYSSKQRSQNKRLQQEYAYKEDVAKIYYGLKTEIEKLGTSELGERLNNRILQLIISVVENNPSSTLDNNSHNDKGPFLEALKNLEKLIKSNPKNDSQQ